MSLRFPPHLLRATRSLCVAPRPSVRLATSTRTHSHYTSNHAYSTQWIHPQSSNRTPFISYVAISTLLGTLIYFSLPAVTPELNDAPPTSSLSTPPTTNSPVPTTITADDPDKIPTGTSTIPYFPRKIFLPRSPTSSTGSRDGKSAALPAGLGAVTDEEEYHLLGLGIRKVSFLRIQVYVVGFYVALSDMGKLQEAMVRAGAGVGTASTLVDGEKDGLKRILLDGEGSEKVWGSIFKDSGLKSAIRIVPTRGTEFGHLRDGWVRSIDARSKGDEFENESFKAAVGEFKKVFGGRQGVGKGRVLLMGRGGDGNLGVWVEQGEGEREGKMVRLGGVRDERVGRLVWLGYLAGGKVASEEARTSVVDGVMEIVERPVGTVETQVI